MWKAGCRTVSSTGLVLVSWFWKLFINWECSSTVACLSSMHKAQGSNLVPEKRIESMYLSKVWWPMPVIPALRKVRQEDWEFGASLNYTVRPCLQNSVGQGKKEDSWLHKMSALGQTFWRVFGSMFSFCNFPTNLKWNRLDMVVYPCNPSTWEVEARGIAGLRTIRAP